MIVLCFTVQTGLHMCKNIIFAKGLLGFWAGTKNDAPEAQTFENIAFSNELISISKMQNRKVESPTRLQSACIMKTKNETSTRHVKAISQTTTQTNTRNLSKNFRTSDISHSLQNLSRTQDRRQGQGPLKYNKIMLLTNFKEPPFVRSILQPTIFSKQQN